MTESHNYTIAHGYEDIYGGFITTDTMPELCKIIVNANISNLNNPKYKHLIVMLSKLKTKYDHISRELIVFKYCPDCGKKIDWSDYE